MSSFCFSGRDGYPGGCPTDGSEYEITRSVKPLGRIKEILVREEPADNARHPLALLWECLFGSVLPRRPLLRMDGLRIFDGPNCLAVTAE